MSENITVGLVLAKNVAQAHGADATDKTVLRVKRGNLSGPGATPPAWLQVFSDGGIPGHPAVLARSGPWMARRRQAVPRRYFHPAQVSDAVSKSGMGAEYREWPYPADRLVRGNPRQTLERGDQVFGRAHHYGRGTVGLELAHAQDRAHEAGHQELVFSRLGGWQDVLEFSNFPAKE